MCEVINIVDAIRTVFYRDYELATKHNDQAAMLRIPGEQEHYNRALLHAVRKVDTIVH